MSIQELISTRKVFSAAVIDSAEDAVPLAKALLAGGLDVMEVTLRNPDAFECIRRICSEVPEMTVGAGTVISPTQIDEARQAGAQFALSPGFNPSVAKAAVQQDFLFIPGVMTPGEMEQSLELGCHWVKLYPAFELGIDFINALAAPYSHTPLRLLPLEGINEDNLSDYLAAPMVVAVAGSWLTNRKLIAEKQWDQITTIAQRTLAKANSLAHSPT